MNCLNCYSEYIPTLSNPICQQCGFCYYCRDFLSCIHYKEKEEDNICRLKRYPQKHSLRLSSQAYRNRAQEEKKWDSYRELSLSLENRDPHGCFAAVIIIDESTRRGLGKSNMIMLLHKLQMMQQPLNCYIDILPTGSSDNDIIRIVNSYKAIPVFLLTSDKELSKQLPNEAILVKSKGTSNAVRIIYNTIRYRIKRL